MTGKGIKNILRVTDCQNMLVYNDTPVQELTDPLFHKMGVRLLMKREELNHPFVSGNKWWKLKYNLEEAERQKSKTVLTFGGAYSNHIYATAAAAKELGLKSIGIIRGERTLPLNQTLSFAESCGMYLQYLPRSTYREKRKDNLIEQLRRQHGEFYLIPEGGSNDLAVKGVKEFACTLKSIPFDYLCAPVGTGGTLAGLITAFGNSKQIVGFSALKGGEFLEDEIIAFLGDTGHYASWQLETAYHFGGYGKVTKELLAFLNNFQSGHGFALDPIYTGKMMAGLFDLIQQGYFRVGTVILAIHTGGLQGWSGIKQS